MSDGVESRSAERDGSVRVVGTAHVSAESVEEVEHVIEEERPEVVAVELDEGRYRQMKGETPDDLDASDLLRGNTVFQFLAYWLLSYVQARMGDEFDIKPGADMMAAVETAEEYGLDVALIDRDIQVTIQRFWARLTATEKVKMMGALALGVTDGATLGLSVGLFVGVFGGLLAEALLGPFVLPTALAVGAVEGALPGVVGGVVGTLVGLLAGLLDALLVGLAGGLALGAALGLLFGRLAAGDVEEEISMEDLTDTDVVSALMEEFRRFSPGGAEALIDERDAFIAHRLVDLRDRGHRVVAVVGAGHREGIEGYLERPETLPPMASLVGTESGSRFSVYKLFGYLFTLGFLAFFALLAMSTVGNEFLLRLFAAWFLVNGAFAFVLARLAGAHWSSATVGGAIAWLTSVNPLLAPGWFAGYVELKHQAVNVGDIATLNEIISDEELALGEVVDRMFKVPLFKLIMIVAATNLGSFVASVLFATVVLPYMFADVGGVDEIARLMLEGARRGLDLVAGGLL